MKASAAERGEHPGSGPEWACDRYGHGDHDYNHCPECMERFHTYLDAKRSLSTLGLLTRIGRAA